MQLRWHDPQPMAMLQHGGRMKVAEAPPLVPEPQASDSLNAGREKRAERQESRLQSIRIDSPQPETATRARR